jgi:AcrR family transcriptional regulator
MAKRDEENERRRVPTQQRSRARVARILDAAALEFAEVGFDAATTEGIAARAGTSIGSLYQFFPNKKALFEAIWRRYLDEARSLFEQLMQEGPRRAREDWRAFIDEVIEAFWQFDRESVAFRAVWRSVYQSSGFMTEGEALNQAMAARVAPLLGVVAPNLSTAKLQLIATMVIETLSSLLFLALRRDEQTARAIVDESKVLLRRYLEPYASSPPRASSG